MFRILLTVAAALAVGFDAAAKAADFRPLFNGKDLDGWVAEGVDRAADGSPVWTVKDGMIHCAGNGFGFLRYEREEFSDFTYHVEFRMAPKCNSGLGVRTGKFDPKKSRQTRPSYYSYEIQLTDDAGKAPDVHSTGSLYRYVAPRENAVKPAGEWNTIEVTCVGPKIRVVLNGREVVDADQSTVEAMKDKPLKGNVCLQNHGGTIDFRAVSVKELTRTAATGAIRRETLSAAAAEARLNGGAKSSSLTVTRRWSDGLAASSVKNTGETAVRVKEVVLFKAPHALSPETGIYGEGFQMLSQTGGTLGKPVNLGGYSDPKHYKIPQPADATTVYSLLTLSPPGEDHVVLGFTSCRRFAGRFHLRPDSLEVVLDTEGLELAAGEGWDLEGFFVASGPDRNALLDRFAAEVRKNHPPRAVSAPPAGWCSWYCFGPRVTSAQVLANLDVIARDVPRLKDVQLDDGYQRAMGDWLEVGKAFGGGVRDLLAGVREKGFEPAIWVAPFVAEKDSHLFEQHPDWFVKDDSGRPLASNLVTFGGWRRGPWYALDGTHPEVQAHFEALFRTMREGWGCTYFKLDANFWGAMHGGRFHDPKATRVEAYRRGMEAIRRGAGDTFLLGCNHPIWPSLGLIDGSRSSGDIKRTWPVFARTARENLSRNWQNGTLWWNDPDCVVLTGPLSEDEYRFHATAVFASGGLILSGDDLTKIAPGRLEMLRKLLPPSGVAARFEDATLRVGVVALPGREAYCLFNWGETSQSLSVRLRRSGRVRDVWTGDDLGRREGTLAADDLAPHSARLLVCTPE